MEKLKQRWGLKTNWDVIAVLCVFAINGSFAAKIGGPILDYFNITPENTSTWAAQFAWAPARNAKGRGKPRPVFSKR